MIMFLSVMIVGGVIGVFIMCCMQINRIESENRYEQKNDRN